MRSGRLACLALPLLLAAAPALAELAAEEVELKVAVESQCPDMTGLLKQWVELNTGSWNLAGLEAFARDLTEPFEALGFEVEVIPGVPVEVPGRELTRTGPSVIARRPSTRSEPLRLLLVGHYDTVYEPDSPFQRFDAPGDGAGNAFGPGVADMKGGLVVMLCALRGLAETSDLDRASWTVILNGDEEIGSLGSREQIEAEAREVDYGLVFEASYGWAMVHTRRGLGQFHLEVEGVAAHAGNAHARGRSAIRELAHKILEIEALTDYERGVTLNVGTMAGGSKRNIIPARASAWIDLRYDDPETGDWARARLEEIAATTFVEGTRTRLWGTLHRPPKAETEEVTALLDRYDAVVHDLGLPPAERVHSGGGTDGSLMGAVGLPTLDSMGVVGGNAHTSEEFVVLDRVSDRTFIAAIFLRRLIHEPRGSAGD
jgi:glutamate carboxypeptidase